MHHELIIHIVGNICIISKLDLAIDLEKPHHMTDLEQAIPYGQQALEAPPVDHPNRGKCLTRLGFRFDDRFKMTGQMTDLNQAIRIDYQTRQITSVDHPDCVECCYSLGTRFIVLELSFFTNNLEAHMLKSTFDFQPEILKGLSFALPVLLLFALLLEYLRRKI